MDLRRSAFLLLTAAATATGCKLERNPPRAGADGTRAEDEVALLGLRTVIYHVADLDAAKEWYASLLGTRPSFDAPFYVGFTVGGFELGLAPDTTTVAPGAAGAVAYWGVTNADSAFARALAAGATSHEPVQAVGGGVRIGSVRDPFGNILGLVENPDFQSAAR
ncbi:MAG: VOC family protein [Longimicrobiales bacterium]